MKYACVKSNQQISIFAGKLVWSVQCMVGDCDDKDDLDECDVDYKEYDEEWGWWTTLLSSD